MRKFKGIIKSTKELSKDILILSGGVLIAQIIPFLLQPYLKRVFSPEEFGSYDIYLKFFFILVALSTLKYENAILLTKKDTDSKHILYLSILISLFIFVIITITVIFFNKTIISHLSGITSLSLLLLPLSVLSYSIFNASNMYLIRRKKFLLSSTNKVSRRLFEGIVQSLFGYFKNPHGLLIGDVVGNIIQAFFCFWKVSTITLVNKISFRKIKSLFIEYRELPIYTLIPNVLNTFVLGSLTFLVLSKFELKEVGYLEFTQKILSIPSVFISMAVSQVVFQRVSQLVLKGKKIIPLLLSVVAVLILISICFVITILFFGEEIFVLIGGEDWINSGVYARILVYGSSIMLIFSPLGKVLIALKKYKINSIWELGKFFAIISLFFINNKSIIDYLKIYTLLISLFYLIYGTIIFYISYKYQLENTQNK